MAMPYPGDRCANSPHFLHAGYVFLGFFEDDFMESNDIELEYVGFWARVGASIIDTLLILSLIHI